MKRMKRALAVLILAVVFGVPLVVAAIADPAPFTVVVVAMAAAVWAINQFD